MDISHEDFVSPPSDGLLREEAALEAARAQAMAEMNAALAADASRPTGGGNANYSMHDVPGFGRYVIPRREGWKPLLEVIHDPVPNVDFSANIYPNFDGVIGERFNSPYLLDPLNDKYESYENLRDNLAAVRNFLLQAYYADTPEGVTNAKAKVAMTEIATFIGDGLYNNFRFMHVIPNHNPMKPFIDISEAAKTGGSGAQYIYEKVLEMQRHSSWMRPFDAVAQLFGGKKTYDWQLPEASKTHFTDLFSKDILNGTVAGAETAAMAGSIEAAQAKLAALEAARQALSDRKALANVAVDLDAIGNQLLFTADNMVGVAHIAEPVRRDAVEIAKDILRKLKVSIGNLNVLDGLKMKPSDDMAALGAVKGVAMTYERLLAWARGNNDTEILQHPSVLAATRAIGQLGYLAKLEARRMAVAAGNTVMAENISQQLARVPAIYATATEATFGGLLEKVERGIDTVIERIQEVSVSGAKVGLSVNNRGTTMDAPPTAGNANQMGAQQTAALATAQAAQLAALAHAQHVSTQQSNAARTQQNRPQAGQSSQAPQAGQARMAAVPPRPGQPNRATTRPATTSANSTSRPIIAPNGMMTPAQLAAMRNAAASHHAQEEEALHHQHDAQVQQQQLVLQSQARARAAAAAQAKTNAVTNAVKAAAMGIDLKTIKGIQNATSLAGVTGNGDLLKPGRRIDPAHVAQASNKSQALSQSAAGQPIAPLDPHDPHAPNAPSRGGRGF